MIIHYCPRFLLFISVVFYNLFCLSILLLLIFCFSAYNYITQTQVMYITQTLVMGAVVRILSIMEMDFIMFSKSGEEDLPGVGLEF